MPLAYAYDFLRQRDYRANALAAACEGMSPCNVATYMADARAEGLPLVSPFSSDPRHSTRPRAGEAAPSALATSAAHCRF